MPKFKKTFKDLNRNDYEERVFWRNEKRTYAYIKTFNVCWKKGLNKKTNYIVAKPIYNKYNKTHLLINPNFFKGYTNGTKSYEFRKASKNITEGVKYFFDSTNWKYLGSAKLKPYITNPAWWDEMGDPIEDGYSYTFYFEDDILDDGTDWDTAMFVKQNYIDKDINFVAYKISNVKEAKND